MANVNSPPHWEGADSKQLREADDVAAGLHHDGVPVQRHVAADQLARKLSARQVQMIAIGGTIGTGLFLGKDGQDVRKPTLVDHESQALANPFPLVARRRW